MMFASQRSKRLARAQWKLVRENQALKKRLAKAEARLKEANEEIEQLNSDVEFEMSCRRETAKIYEDMLAKLQKTCEEKMKELKEDCELYQKRVVERIKEDFQTVLANEMKKSGWNKMERIRLEKKIEQLESGSGAGTSESAPPPQISIPQCQICRYEFSDNPEKTPRILECGHTLCEECVEGIAEMEFIKCPFDRLETKFKATRVAGLPKNFAIIDMLDPNHQCQ